MKGIQVANEIEVKPVIIKRYNTKIIFPITVSIILKWIINRGSYYYDCNHNKSSFLRKFLINRSQNRSQNFK